MTSITNNVVFDDIFTINAIDKEGKKFDRVSRLYAHSKNCDMDLTLDYNVELLPLEDKQSFSFALATSLSKGFTDSDEKDDAPVWRPDGKGRKGLEEDYDYVMYGKIYKFDSGNSEQATVYASFGGLLMSLSGGFRHLTSLVLGDSIYLLLRR
ncbi:RNA polymerase [Flagelloscypha sp. PMI_526]|nr:RNA polymerase [Flagelloscypha sp. PMI_526]